MRPFARILIGLVAINLGIMPIAAAVPVVGVAKKRPIPPFADVQKAVLKYFDAKPDYKSGDLINKDDVTPLLAQLQKLGLPLADADQILAKVPLKDEFLVRQLSTSNGRRFMRRIATYPDGYDRVDRLSRLPQGQQTVRMLVADPRGDRMIEYMTNTKGGMTMGRMLSADPNGANFNAPTGRIYTAEQLLNRLRQSHTAAMKAADKKSP